MSVTAKAHEAIAIDSGVGESHGWTTVTRKGNRKENFAGDENIPAGRGAGSQVDSLQKTLTEHDPGAAHLSLARS